MCVGGIALLKNHQDRIPRPHPRAGLVCPHMCGGSGHSRRAGRFCTGFSFVKFIYFSAGLGLCCRRRAFSSCCAGLLIAVHATLSGSRAQDQGWYTGCVAPLACGIFPVQRSHPYLLPWQANSLSPSHQGSPALGSGPGT